MNNKKPTTLIGILFFIQFLSDVPKTKNERIIFGIFKYTGYATIAIILLLSQTEKIPYPTKNYVDAALLCIIMTFMASMMIVCLIGIGQSKGNTKLWGQIRAALKGVWKYILLPSLIVTVISILIFYLTNNLAAAPLNR